MFTRCRLTSPQTVAVTCVTGRPLWVRTEQTQSQSLRQTNKWQAQAAIDQGTKIASSLNVEQLRVIRVKARNKTASLYVSVMPECAASQTSGGLIADEMCAQGVCKVVDQYQRLNGCENLLSRLRTKPPHPHLHSARSPKNLSKESLKANPFLYHKRGVWGKQHSTAQTAATKIWCCEGWADGWSNKSGL